MSLRSSVTIPVNGAQLRVRFASIASTYALAAPFPPTTDRPSNDAGAATPMTSSIVGARSMSRARPSNREPEPEPEPDPEREPQPDPEREPELKNENPAP